MILIGLGHNLCGADGTPPLETCRRAAAQLDALPGLRLRALSRWYLTDPLPPSGQPAYVNAVAVLRVEAPGTEPDPGVLLATLQAIEARAGRVRSEPDAARTLDLDIIAMGEGGQMVQDAPDPILPHPRASAGVRTGASAGRCAGVAASGAATKGGGVIAGASGAGHSGVGRGRIIAGSSQRPP